MIKFVGMKNKDNPLTAEEIGARIRAAIEASSFKEVEPFARFVGRSADTIYKMNRGEGVTQFMHLSNIARALNVTPNDLLGFNSAAETSALLEGFVGAFEEATGLSETESRLLVQGVLEGVKAPVVRSVERDSVLRDRGAAEARRLFRSKLI